MELLWSIASIRSEILDKIISLVTRLGEEIIVIVVLCAIFWCIDKKLAYCIGISYFLSGLLVQGLKISFRIDRPWILDSSFKPVASAVEGASGYSFPSGHTASASSLFGTLGLSLKKGWQKTVCFILVLIVAFSRMYLGVHTLLDVSVAALVSLVIAFIIVKVYGKNNDETLRKQIVFPIILAVIAVLTVILAATLYNSNIIVEGYVTDCLKAAGAGIGFAIGMFIEKKYVNFSTKCRSIWLQIAKYAFGLVGVLAIKEGLKLVIGIGLVADTFRYVLIGLFMTAIYPILIKKLFQVKE